MLSSTMSGTLLRAVYCLYLIRLYAYVAFRGRSYLGRYVVRLVPRRNTLRSTES